MNLLEFAMNMEIEMEKYYIKQARNNEENGLHSIFLMLAEDERRHMELLESKINQLSWELVDRDTLMTYKNIFHEIHAFKNQIKSNLDILDVCRIALEKEKESINLYGKILSKATDDNGKKLFEHLIQEEKIHYSIFDEIVSHISRAEEWVESAEFGLREEY